MNILAGLSENTVQYPKTYQDTKIFRTKVLGGSLDFNLGSVL